MAALAAVAMAGGVMLSGCATARGIDMNGEGTVCTGIPLEPGQRGVFGNHFTVNQPVTLDRVELVDAEGMELVDAYVLSLTDEQIAAHDGSGGIGAMQLGGEEFGLWDLREPLSGAQLVPGTTTSVLAVVEREDGAEVSRARALRLHYSTGGTSHVEQGVVGVVVAGEACSDED